MIVTMTLWIIVVTLSCLLVGMQIFTGIQVPQIMDIIYPVASGTLLAQSALFGLAYFFHQRRLSDYTTKTR